LDEEALRVVTDSFCANNGKHRNNAMKRLTSFVCMVFRFKVEQ
jgi:hypothetical protein